MITRRTRPAALAVALLIAAAAAAAQSAPELIALGDSAYKDRRQTDALAQFTAAIAADPTHYEALWKASRSEVDLAEVTSNPAALESLLAAGRRHAEAAVRARPSAAEGHFSVARAAGRRALSAGIRERIRLSRIIRDAALAALAIDSAHPGALHVLGMWNAEVMRVNGLSRIIARTFLGADVFDQASWAEAQRLLESAVQHDPGRIVHRLDLAGIYADVGDVKRARELYESIASAAIIEPNDDLYKRQAAERLTRLRGHQSARIQ